MNRITTNISLFKRLTFQNNGLLCQLQAINQPPPACRSISFVSIKPTQIRLLHCENHARLYSTQKLKRPSKRAVLFDESSVNVAKDTVIFSYPDNNWKYILLMGMGLTIFLVLLNSSYTIYVTMKNVVDKDAQNPENKWWQWWKKVNFGATAFRVTLSSILVGAGALMLAFSISYPLRMVKQITLLKGGDKILMTTYAPLGKSRTYNLPLSHVSAQWSQEQAKDVLPIKVKGKRFHFLINKQGHFPNQQLFDNTLALARKL